MTKREIENMPTIEIGKYIYDYIDRNQDSLTSLLSYDGGSGLGHSLNRHTDLSDLELVDRAVNERKSVSQMLEYYNEDMELRFCPNQYLKDVIEFSMTEIVEWLENTDEMKRLNITLDYGDIVGYGYEKETYQKKDTPIITVCFEKSYTSSCPLSFYVATMYPNIDHPKANYINREKDIYCDGRKYGEVTPELYTVENSSYCDNIINSGREEYR